MPARITIDGRHTLARCVTWLPCLEVASLAARNGLRGQAGLPRPENSEETADTGVQAGGRVKLCAAKMICATHRGPSAERVNGCLLDRGWPLNYETVMSEPHLRPNADGNSTGLN